MASFVYTAAMQKMLLNASALPMDNTNTYKLMLVSTSQASNKADTVVSTNLTGAELSLASFGYVGGFGGSGRKGSVFKATPTIASNVVQIIFNASTLVWTAIGGASPNNPTIVGVALIKEVTNDANSIPIAYWDLSSGVGTNGSDFTLTLSATGNIQITT